MTAEVEKIQFISITPRPDSVAYTQKNINEELLMNTSCIMHLLYVGRKYWWFNVTRDENS